MLDPMIKEYKVDDECFRGGMSRIRPATNVLTNTRVVLKFYRDEKSFSREMDVLKQLKHTVSHLPDALSVLQCIGLAVIPRVLVHAQSNMELLGMGCGGTGTDPLECYFYDGLF